MKNIINNIQEFLEKPYAKRVIFFGFYFIFFIFVFIYIGAVGNKNHLKQEYEKGNKNLFSENGLFSGNFYYDYKVTLDGTLHDYYGKMYYQEESFKYNNIDYYKDEDVYYKLDDTWKETSNPFLFREFIDLEKLNLIMSNSMYYSKTEYEDGIIEHKYLISCNTLNKLLYNQDTDYDDISVEILVKIDNKGNLSGITYYLDTFCKYQDFCNSLKIDLSYEMFGEVHKLVKPSVDNTW